MKTTRYLLMGGGLASGQAAKKIREHDPAGAITLVGEELHVPYDRPPLSKEFLRGEKTRDDLFFDTEKLFEAQKIELVLGATVQHLDLPTKTARLAGGEAIVFEKALIATGGRPIRLKLPGGDLPRVHYLRTLEDSAGIAALARPGQRAVLIGAGFIGMEVAASLTQRGVQVTVIEGQPHIWPRFADGRLAGFFQEYCTRHGVTFLTGETVTEILGPASSSVITRSGKELSCDFVCVAVGIVPNVELAQEAGLTVDNGVVVNECLQSSHPDVYAAGDVANYLDPIFGRRRRVEHWGHAEYTGQIAGQNMAGLRSRYDLLTYAWSDIFDLHLEFAGDESEHDQVLLRGRFEEQAFTVLYLKDGRLRAYFAINQDSREIPSLQGLIRSRKSVAGKESQLVDPHFAIQGLL